MNHYDDNVNAQRIKRDCHPSKLAKPIIGILQTVVSAETQVTVQSALSELTNRFIAQTYRDLAAEPSCANCFESEENFMRFLTRGVIAQAQEYNLSMHAERRLPPPKSDERGR